MWQGTPFPPLSSSIFLNPPQVEQWCEHHYPSFVKLSTKSVALDPGDARTRVVMLEQQLNAALVKKQQNGNVVQNGAVAQRTDGAVALKDVVMYASGALLAIFSIYGGMIWLGE